MTSNKSKRRNKHRLSPHFYAWEFACTGASCCRNSCPMDSSLIKAIEELRVILGRSIKITSGFRCRTKNDRTKHSAKNSAHIKGLACDIKVPGMSPAEVAEIAKTIPAFKDGSIGVYNTFLHLATDGRGARWAGKY